MPADICELLDPGIAPSDGDLTSYLHAALQRCTPWFKASGASIFLRDRHEAYTLAAQFATHPPIPAGSTITPGEGVAGACLELGRPLLVKDVRAEPALAGRAISPRQDLGTSMVVPLIVPRNNIVGVLNLSRRRGEPDFDTEDLSVAATLGRQIAMAVESARILAERSQAHEWLKRVIDCIPAAVLVLEPDGRLSEANEQGRLLEHLNPDWLSQDQRAGRERVQQPGGQTWKVDRIAAGEGWVIVAEDTTEQEKENQESARLLRLAEIGQMSAAVAHEIRNPLTGIRAAAQVVAQSPDQAPEMAAIIEEEVMKLNTLCEDFLDFARPLNLVRRPHNLSKVAERVLLMERPSFTAAGVDLILEAPAISPTISIDALRIEQVMRNLLQNALQASSPGTTTTLRIVETGFEVEDGGSGMSEETMERIFVPFFTTKPRGTGLGLSGMRKIVEAHGGKITVQSTLGTGSRFLVELGGSQ